MKWLWILLALVLGAVAGTYWLADPGYVLIRLNSWLVETSAAFALLLIMTAVAALSIGWRFLRQVSDSTGKLATWQQNKTHKARLELLQQGLVAVLNRSWGQAGKALSRMDAVTDDAGKTDVATPYHRFAQLMLTAFAAHARGDMSLRDEVVQRIQQHDAGYKPATRAFCAVAFRSGEVAQAIAKLTPLLTRNKQTPYFFR
ncbi:MAG: hypothetical protein CM15mP68_6410 [Pseudomonadota bacterium]|nr:MAG: hypothetical protein CM15mP68_6410 [Pseudomonadota bacterium]